MKREAGHTFLARLGKKRLHPGGKLLTHDVMLAAPNREAVENMHAAIHVKAEPLVREAWEELFRE